MEVPECFYRISIKALILNGTRDKFLVCEEESGIWELPGGGLDWGATPHEDVSREILEEMGLKVTRVADHPSYFITDDHRLVGKIWFANVVYEVEVENLEFTPSDECINIRFVDKDDLENLNVFPNVRKIAEQFKPENHQ